MALSNWLTRGEWNAAYFAYFLSENFVWPCDLSTHLRTGICILDKYGYKKWTGLSVDDNEDLMSVRKDENKMYGVHACTSEGDNASCLAEIMLGNFDHKTRLEEAIEWINLQESISNDFKEKFKKLISELLQ